LKPFNDVMPVDHIRYDVLAQDALRGVVRSVLQDAAQNGLPGEHHFYISFDPRADGVKVSDRLREQYPEEMTIILQHQFWDLVVGEERFEVGLSFGGIPERLTVPFDAIKGFFDPSVQFGLQFETIVEDGGQVTQDTGDHKPRPLPVPANPDQSGPVAVPDPAPPAEDKPAAEVVRLDKFRKK
jgi:hypothetical protein